jgi:hypothetical protein
MSTSSTTDTKAGGTGRGTGLGAIRKGGKAKLIVVLVLGVAVFIAAQTGIIGYGWAQLKSTVFPSDEALLEYIPRDAGPVAIIDPHQLDQAALGEEQSAARAYIKRVRDDVKKATDIDLAFDIDKLVVSQGVVVARGRFSQKALEERLIENRYVVSEHHGVRYLVRQGDDAIAVIGSVLLYGGEEGVRAAIDAEAGDLSLGDDEPTKRRLSQLGWDRAVLATVRVTDDKPSLRAILTGSTGPRAITLGIATKQGKLEIDAVVEAASSSAAEELAKLLEERRVAATPESLTPTLGDEAAQVLAEVAKTATIKAEPVTSSVRIHMTMDTATQDKLAKAVQRLIASDLTKALRLYQLLAPTP